MKKNEPKPVRVMFAGASGTGKTTLANFITQGMGDSLHPIPFVSGSVSDLLPDTKDMPHQDMLARDSQTLLQEDYQILNLRNKQYQPYVVEDKSFVTDRSYLDSAAYFLYKQADKIPPCEMEQFLNLCQMCLTKQCTHLIFVPFTQSMFKGWITEDNGKRITSRYFQMEISRIMQMVLDIWDFKYKGTVQSTGKFFDTRSYDDGLRYGEITSPYGTTKVFILNEVNLKNREELIQYILLR